MHCPWLTKNPTTKAKGYILLKKGQRQKQKALSFLHKGIINNNSFTLELVILSIKNIITSQKTDRYFKIPTTKSKGKKNEKNLPG